MAKCQSLMISLIYSPEEFITKLKLGFDSILVEDLYETKSKWPLISCVNKSAWPKTTFYEVFLKVKIIFFYMFFNSYLV